MSRVKIVHVLNKRKKKDLIDTIKRIIACPAVLNYNTNKLSTFNRRGLVCGFYFIIFISGIQFSRGIVCLRQRRQSRQSICIGTAGEGLRRKLWFFCAKQFSRGKQYVAASLALHPQHNIGLRCVCIYICASDDCVFITHTTRNSLTFFRRVLCATSLRVCVGVRVCACAYAST